MQIFHLLDIGEMSTSTITPLLYGRITTAMMSDGKVAFDNHLFSLDTESPPDTGEKLMIWCEHEYYCCKLSEYEKFYSH